MLQRLRPRMIGPIILSLLFNVACANFDPESAPLGEALNKSCQELAPSLNTLNLPGPYQYNPKELNRWFSTSAQPQGVFLLIHGLNNLPSSMDFLANELTQRDYQVLRVSLDGHRGDLEELINLERTDWQNTVYSAYCLASARASSNSVPLYILGNSLGALMATEVMISRPKTEIDFEKMIFFAPAITPHFYTYLVKFFRIFGKRFVLGSKAPKKYRANKGTSNAAYRALFEASERVRAIGKSEKLNRPTLIFLDPDDELVSESPLKKMMKKKNLTQWQLVTVSTKNTTLDESYHHLIIDQPSVGPLEWKRMMTIMEQFLGE